MKTEEIIERSWKMKLEYSEPYSESKIPLPEVYQLAYVMDSIGRQAKFILSMKETEPISANAAQVILDMLEKL